MQHKHKLRNTLIVLAALVPSAKTAHSALTDCATSWSNFDNPGFVSEYTSGGQVIADEETSADSSHGPAAVTPRRTDLASGSPGSFPGPEATSYFGYYDGGTVYDPNDPNMMEDDYILFRMRVEGDPSTGDAFDSKHWNVLFDVDGDGYKEYWVDLDGAFQSGPKEDRLQILYDNSNRQDIDDPDAVRVEAFTAYHTEDNDASCPASSPGLSHTRSYAVGDGTGDYFIEMQIPMTAFNDLNGNQVLFPDSPVAFVFSTGASNKDPLQKDFMQDLNFLTLADPITFGDIIVLNGQPRIEFTDVNLEPVDFYSVNDDVYVYLTDPLANTDSNTVECINVTVTDPATGDDESVTLCESGPNTGIFTNQGGTCKATITNPSPAPTPPTAWLTGISTSSSTIDENWTLTYSASTSSWTVVGSVSGVQSATASHGVAYTTDGGEFSFTLYEDASRLSDATVLSTCTRGADPLPSSSAGGTDDDGTLQVFSGDDIYVSYTNANSVTVTDTVPIIGVCGAFISFTRATGLVSTNFTLDTDSSISDQLYVTVFHPEANADSAVAETITVVLTGHDTQTLTLTETGIDTGEFRNTSGLPSQIDDGTVTAEDNLWEDIDLGTVTATYDYICGGSSLSVDTTASLFATAGGGRVEFTNGAGTLDVDTYGAALPVWLKVTDSNACTSGGALQVTVTSAAGDSETITLYETFSGSGVFMNRVNDLVTTAGSAVVTSASSTFVTDGVMAGDTFAIADGPDVGTYTVASVDSETQITLTTTLTTTRTGVGFNAIPLMTGTNDGSITADDDLLEADHNDVLTVSYTDCDDGDADSSNDVKIDTAVYNAPSLLINEVLFYPDTAASSCQTEAVELYNAGSSPITATGYTITDEDGFSYTVPQLSGADIVLQPGEKVYLSLWDGSPPNDFFLTDTYYLFTSAGSTFPSDRFADPAGSDPADQVSLFDSFGVVQDYYAWSSTLTPSLDFYSDDSPAVLRSIWQDDAFSSVSGIPLASSMARTSDGFDTNQPSDWEIVTNNTCQIILTRAFISSFRVFREGGAMVAEWKTSSESGTLGFYLFRLDEQEERYLRVNDEFLPGLIDSPQGGTYRLLDRGAHGPVLTYVVMEVESSGSRTRPVFHGPYTVVPDESGVASTRRRRGSRQESIPHGMTAREVRRLLARERIEAGGGRRARRGRGATQVKIAVERDGLYSLGVDELAGWFDVPRGRIKKALLSGRLRLTNQGSAVAWTRSADRNALLFWGQELESIYTRENIYWLAMGRGRRMRSTPSARARRNAEEGVTFYHTLHAEQDHFPATTVATDPESDYWYWGFISAGNPTSGRHAFTLNVAGLAAAPVEASLTVQLVGATDVGGQSLRDHHVRVRVNGYLVGEARFDGIGAFTETYSFDQNILREGENNVELEGVLDTGASFSIFYIDAFELTYARTFHADATPFVFRPDGERVLSITGFAEPDVALFDITDPRRPKIVTGAKILPDGETFTLRFTPRSAESIFVAVIASGVAAPDAIWADRPSNLRAGSNAADYVVIAPTELETAAGKLAGLRRSSGMTAKVVLFEDVLDEFNDGIDSPHAIRKFLAHAHRRWSKAPRFIALAGAGNLDYRNNLGLGGNLIPPLMVPTPDGLYASDNRFVDVDQDGWPDMAVGRIPVLTPSELEAYVAKLSAYESGGGSLWRGPLLLVADDDPWSTANFAADTESMVATLPHDVAAERIYLIEQSASEARARLLDGLRRGAPLLNYVGHGGLDRLADEMLLHTSDVETLGNGERLSIVTAFSCSINRFEIMGFQSLGEALTVEASGGAAAVWAPSGLSLDIEARALGSAFFSSVFTRHDPTLGEAILSTFDDYRAGRGGTLLPGIYTLLGDPAIPLK